LCRTSFNQQKFDEDPQIKTISGGLFILTNISNELFDIAQPVWNLSYQHPFITELAAGQLPIEKFRYYLKQDRYYLEQFGDLHEKIATLIDNPADKDILLVGAASMHDGETDIRSTMFQEIGITRDEIQQTPIAPTAYSYVTHMNYELTNGTTASAVAALLPCYWLYSEIGHRLIHEKSPVPIYQEWLDSYASTEFDTGTDQMIELVNHLGENADSAEQALIKDSFLKSSNYELNFWQMAYTMENWAS
jgi:thiaminase/transcriptional activator TenA